MMSRSAPQVARGVLVLLLLGVYLGVVGSEAAGAACTPRVDMQVQRSSAVASTVGYDVTLSAAGAVPGGDQLVRVRFAEARSAGITVGAAVQPVPAEVTLPAGTT